MCPEAGGTWGRGFYLVMKVLEKGLGFLYRNRQDNEEWGKSTENMSLSWMNLGLLEHFNQFHL